jgi:uncharacterized protein YabN with tetrapyrrole methylase and pyrophosphatase domain
MGIDPETALRTSVDRFMSRFRLMERAFAVEGSAMADASPEEFDSAWRSAKAESSEAS